MIPFEIFKSVKICAYVHRFLFEIAKYIYLHCSWLYVYVPTIIFLIYDPAAPANTGTIWKWNQRVVPGTTCMMSNDDHILVPALDILPAYRYTQRNVSCVSNVAGVGLQFLSQSNGVEYFAIANQDIIILRARFFKMEFLL